MKILLLSDLHNRTDWLEWTVTQAHNVDLVAVAGDLLDGYHPDGLLPQMLVVKKWADNFPTALALSSGNHDGNTQNTTCAPDNWVCPAEQNTSASEIMMANHWMDTLKRTGLVTDMQSEILETTTGNIIVTTIPFYPVRTEGKENWEFTDQLWNKGAKLQKETNLPWLVLHHEPPSHTLVGTNVFYKIKEYQPDFVLSGHIHCQPYKDSFADKIGKTWWFNPGAPSAKQDKSSIPNHIVLETNLTLKKGLATWNATQGENRITQKIKLDAQIRK